MKYGILMPYFNRLEQLKRTLVSFEHWYGARGDWRVVIAPDAKANDVAELRAAIPFDGNRYVMLEDPSRFNANTPCPQYNDAARSAHAEFLLPTNPECLHKTNILAVLDEEFARDPNAYVVCACAAVGDVMMPGDFSTLTWGHRDWYQHSKHHNRMLNFCTAISAANYWRIGGFDEDYSPGLGYADDEFRDDVVRAGLSIVPRDDALSLHQEHAITNVGDRHRLVVMNREIYERKRATANA